MPPITKAELKSWLAIDLNEYVRDGIFPHGQRWRWWHRYQFPVIHWQRCLRRAEFAVAARRHPLWKPWVLLTRFRLQRWSIRLNLEIPINVFGPGLTIPHYGTIVVNPKVRAGSYCRIHPGTCLGELKGRNPVVGDNVYIGNGAIIFGDVIIGNGVRVGPHALVRRSINDSRVVVSPEAKPLPPSQQPQPGTSDLEKNALQVV